MGWVLLILGGIVGFAGGLWLLIVAFQESIGWGLASLLIPFVALIFAITHWDKAGKPFLIGLAGNVVAIIGLQMAGMSLFG
jgi:hypothetical protein